MLHLSSHLCLRPLHEEELTPAGRTFAQVYAEGVPPAIGTFLLIWVSVYTLKVS